MGQKKKTAVPQEELLKSLMVLVEDDADIIKSGIDINDEFLLSFLIGRKYNLATAYETIQKYVDVRRRKYVKFFSQLSPMTLLYMYDFPRFMGLLKYRDPITGCMVFVFRSPPDSNTTWISIEDITTALALALDELIYVDTAVNNGLILVASGEGFGFSRMRDFTPARIKILIDICYNAYPFNIKQFHLVQCSSLFNATVKICKPFLPRKLRNRIVVHNTIESFHDVVPPNVTPSWAGGTGSAEKDWEVFDYTLERATLDRTEYHEKLAKRLAEGMT